MHQGEISQFLPDKSIGKTIAGGQGYKFLSRVELVVII